jgi:fungal STAND N-terminal Goodbye domain
MSLPTASSANFQSILDAALDDYARQTGVDLTRHPSAEKLQSCHSPDDVIRLLLEKETAFKDYRDNHRNLIDRLRPVVQVVHAFSGVLGEAFQPTKVIFVGIDVLLSVCIPFILSCPSDL